MKTWKLRKKLLGIVFISIVLVVLYNPFSVEVSTKDCISNSNFKCEGNTVPLKAFATHYCIDKSSIFFVETSNSNVLNTRQACAIESTARHNPSFHVNVLMTPTSPINFSNNILRSLIKIPNVHIIKINIEDLVCGTPIRNWYLAGKWKKSKWKASHLSDALRFFLVWKYGGMYLDMDIVTLRSLEHWKNTVITENWERIAAGMLIFDRGHELMEKCMTDFAKNYDASNFVVNGPGIVTRNVKALCDIENIGKVSGAGCDIDIQPPEAAFPIPYDEWEKFFLPSSVTKMLKTFNSSHMIHVWNKYSKASKLIAGKNSLYELAMKEHCSAIYKHVQLLGYA